MDEVKPCVACVNQYGYKICSGLGHCSWEDSGENPTGVPERKVSEVDEFQKATFTETVIV